MTKAEKVLKLTDCEKIIRKHGCMFKYQTFPYVSFMNNAQKKITKVCTAIVIYKIVNEKKEGKYIKINEDMHKVQTIELPGNYICEYVIYNPRCYSDHESLYDFLCELGWIEE